MKIEGPGRASGADKSKKKDQVGGSGSFGSLLSGGATETPSAGATQSIARIDSLLSAQSVDDPAARAARKRMRERAHGLLDELDKIRVGILSGQMTVGHIIDIADVVASHREKIMDPQLTGILDEIDMRAQIELAKMRVALDKPV